MRIAEPNDLTVRQEAELAFILKTVDEKRPLSVRELMDEFGFEPEKSPALGIICLLGELVTVRLGGQGESICPRKISPRATQRRI